MEVFGVGTYDDQSIGEVAGKKKGSFCCVFSSCFVGLWVWELEFNFGVAGELNSCFVLLVGEAKYRVWCERESVV